MVKLKLPHIKRQINTKIKTLTERVDFFQKSQRTGGGASPAQVEEILKITPESQAETIVYQSKF